MPTPTRTGVLVREIFSMNGQIKAHIDDPLPPSFAEV
jgi:hypothetical protein